MITEEHAPGRLVDIHGEGRAGVVLLWHGRGANSRSVVADLAHEMTEHGVRVVVPDWDSTAPDGGRADLLDSLARARDEATGLGRDPDEVVVVGWSLGGTATLGLVMQAPELGVAIRAAVLLSPGDGPRALDPFTGAPLPDPFPEAPHAGPVHVVSATRDDIATPELVRGLANRLRAAGWPVTWTDVDADHGSVAMSRYDAANDRFVRAEDDSTVAVGRQVAELVATACR
ncbi:alpha/beta fold hydrolase [Aeromicrobium sp. NPDC092404]|uniref:alpha/beta hydrolase n=1 Tax=Aeromicrobium sp. NPDC092404 TaxID=3154976 RepID=UPI00341C7950